MSEDLEELALSGDERAWNTLVARHQRRVFVSLIAKGAAVQVARDVSQEAWIKLLQQQRAGKLTSLKLPGLAIRQADFLWRSQRRRSLRRAEDRDEVDTLDRLASPVEGPEQRAMSREGLQRVLAVLRQCSPRSQEIFVAVYQEGLSAAEAAARFGISVQRVRQTLCEVRRQLRSAVGEGR